MQLNLIKHFKSYFSIDSSSILSNSSFSPCFSNLINDLTNFFSTRRISRAHLTFYTPLSLEFSLCLECDIHFNFIAQFFCHDVRLCVCPSIHRYRKRFQNGETDRCRVKRIHKNCSRNSHVGVQSSVRRPLT